MLARLRPRIAGARSNAVVWLVVLGVAWALKHHYSVATPESLRWVLAGPAWLVGALLDTRFAFEHHVGYVSLDVRTAIVPACAGLNFMIMTFGMLATAFAARFRRPSTRLAWVGASFALAYGSTGLVNTLRITTGILLSTRALPFDAAMLHRTLGVLVYLGALVALYGAVDRVLTREQKEASWNRAVAY